MRGWLACFAATAEPPAEWPGVNCDAMDR
jgi:hypothetical protein